MGLLTSKDFYNKASRFFCIDCDQRDMGDEGMTLAKFYSSKSFLFVDLRSNPDTESYGNGKKLHITRSGVLLQMTKIKAVSKDLVTHLFIISEGILNIVNRDLGSIEY